MEKFFERVVCLLSGRPPTQLPAQYERKHQISNGAFSSVFCVKLRGKRNNILYAAKYLKANTDAADREVQVKKFLFTRFNATLASVLKVMKGAPGRQSSPFSPRSEAGAMSTPSRSREVVM